MVKKTKMIKVKARRTKAMVTKATGLDPHAVAWRNLLMDPCGANIVPSCYGGQGTGTYMRVRTLSYTLGGSDTAGVFCFQLGSNSAWLFGTSTGSNVTFSSRVDIFGGQLAGTEQHMRCIAGCVKVRYLGAESARSGQVGLLVSPPQYAPSTAVGASVQTVMSSFGQVTRTGEVAHEVKFVPGPGDEEFDTPAYRAHKSVISVAFSNVPPGSLQLEVIGVYELESTNSGTAGQSSVLASVPAPSNNTLNQVLRTLGPASRWAYSNVGVPVIKAAAGYVTNVVNNGVAMATAKGLAYSAML
jgi:hypothetical protein